MRRSDVVDPHLPPVRPLHVRLQVRFPAWPTGTPTSPESGGAAVMSAAPAVEGGPAGGGVWRARAGGAGRGGGGWGTAAAALGEPVSALGCGKGKDAQRQG